MHIFRSQYQNGRYLPAARVPLGDAAVETHDPAVAPDQSFIIFNYGRTKGGLGRLCIAFRKGDRFSAPEDLGDAVNRDNPWGSRLGGVDYRTVYVTGTTHIWSFSLEH
jgi:hypothetical protein